MKIFGISPTKTQTLVTEEQKKGSCNGAWGEKKKGKEKLERDLL